MDKNLIIKGSLKRTADTLTGICIGAFVVAVFQADYLIAGTVVSIIAFAGSHVLDFIREQIK
jgi:hypothetical protein